MKHCILIVEDTIELRNDLRRTISSHFPDFKILAVRSEIEALDQINSCHISAVITDINLIEGGGTETGGLKVIESLGRKSQEIPIIVVTAYGMKNIEYENKMLSLVDFSTLLGAIKVITRPDPNDDYLDVLVNILENIFGT